MVTISKIGFKMSYEKVAEKKTGMLIPSHTNNAFLDELSFEEDVTASGLRFFELAENYYYGRSGKEQSFEDAFIYYEKAIQNNYIEAYRKVGNMYSDGEFVTQSKTEAFGYYKEGAKQGDAQCYGEMAELFRGQGQINTAQKTWEQYFELSNKVEKLLAFYYVLFVYQNKLPFNFKSSLEKVKKELYDLVTELRNDTNDRDKWEELTEIRELTLEI